MRRVTRTPDRPEAVRPRTRPQERARDARFRRFAKNVVACNFNFTDAARLTGYSHRAAKKIAYELMQRPEIQAMVAEETTTALHAADVNKERVLRELARLAFSDMRHYLRFDERGQVYLDWSVMPDDATRAIGEITQEEFVEGSGTQARLVRKTRFKLHPKTPALDLLCKHLGMLVQRHEISGPSGTPITVDVAALREQLAARLAALAPASAGAGNGSHG